MDSPMLVTPDPLIVLGMTTAPLGQLNLEMLSEPSLLVVNVNWPCTAAGSIAAQSRQI